MGNLIWWASRIQAALTARGPLLENGKYSQIGWAHLQKRTRRLESKLLRGTPTLKVFFTCNDRLSLDILKPDSQSHPGWAPECLQEFERWCWLRQELCRVVQLQEGFSRPKPPQINFRSLIHKGSIIFKLTITGESGVHWVFTILSTSSKTSSMSRP